MTKKSQKKAPRSVSGCGANRQEGEVFLWDQRSASVGYDGYAYDYADNDEGAHRKANDRDRPTLGQAIRSGGFSSSVGGRTAPRCAGEDAPIARKLARA